MHCHCGTNNRARRWTFTDPCKPEVRPGAREESESPAWLAAPAMNARDTTKGIYEGLTLDVDQHYIESVTATTHQEKSITTLESNPSRGTVIPAPHGKGNKHEQTNKIHFYAYFMKTVCVKIIVITPSILTSAWPLLDFSSITFQLLCRPAAWHQTPWAGRGLQRAEPT